MAVSIPNQYPVSLTAEQRERLEEITRNGHAPAKKIRHAQILLLSDRHRPEGPLTRKAIAELLGMHVNSVDRTRKRFVLEGEQPAVERKPRQEPPIQPILDGHGEAQLIAICCSAAPEGRTRWTMELLAEALMQRRIVTQISAETVRRTLKKTSCSPGGNNVGAFPSGTHSRTGRIPERDQARFVAQMEEVLDVYADQHSEEEPLICMDEASQELHGHEQPPLPLEPGQPVREDYHYERRGTQAIFLFVDPLRGWRRVDCSDSRTRVDWAEQVRRLLEEDYPHAQRVKLVCDNLNTHDKASLYEAFPAEQAQRLAQRLTIIHTPRNGSWLNRVPACGCEIELSVLSRQCLDARIGSAEKLKSEIKAWETDRNADHCVVRWRFTTTDARTRLRRLYPQC
jgi:hypothetical protein